MEGQWALGSLSGKPCDLPTFSLLQMSAGPPQRLLIPNWELSTPVVVFNNKKFEEPILVQLADQGGNPTTEAGIRVQLAKDLGLKVCT